MNAIESRPVSELDALRPLRPIERNILAAAPGPGEKPVTRKVLAKLAGYGCNWRFRRAVAEMAEKGLLELRPKGVRRAR